MYRNDKMLIRKCFLFLVKWVGVGKSRESMIKLFWRGEWERLNFIWWSARTSNVMTVGGPELFLCISAEIKTNRGFRIHWMSHSKWTPALCIEVRSEHVPNCFKPHPTTAQNIPLSLTRSLSVSWIAKLQTEGYHFIVSLKIKLCTLSI